LLLSQLRKPGASRKETKMNNNELNQFKSALEAKQAQLSGSLRYRDEIVIERASDTIDEIQMASERELAITTLSRDSHVTRQISGALERIADGSYGVCQHCDEEISSKRLKALPWAVYCIHCQDLIDRHEIEVEIRSAVP